MARVFFAAIIVGGLVLSSICFGYSGGSGTAEDPYQIADANDLLALAADTSNYDKCFILTADIDLDPNLPGGQVFTTAIIASGDVFTGTFDGNSHKITNFTINGNDYLGLFGYIYPGGAVKNLGLEDFAVSGSSDFYMVGGLVGYNWYGSISNCYSTGAVSGSDYVGTLVGYNYGGSISDCYSTGSVSGSQLVGGLVGQNEYGSISNCYSTSAVSGYDAVGGLVGENYGSISNCYFLITSGPDNDYGEPLTDEQMKQQASFTGWDFVGETANGTEDIWRMCIDGVNYPLLWWQFNTADFTCPDGVDFIDFAIFANAWLSDPTQVNWNPRCDIAEPPDSVIDILDLAIFAQHWLEQD